MSELINKAELLADFESKCIKECEFCPFNIYNGESSQCALVVLAPAVDAEPVQHGRWIGTPIGTIKCSLCGGSYNIYKGFAKYCPNCGARMDLEASDR